MRVMNLQNKLLSLRHKITKQQFSAVMQNTKLSKDDLTTHVKADLIQQLTPSVLKAFQIEVIDGIGEYEFRGSGFVLSERDMMNVLLEVAEMDSIGKDNLILSCRKWLGLNT